MEFKAYMIRWLTKPSWDLREAALLLNGLDPDSSPMIPDGRSSHPVDVCYFWLQKEVGKKDGLSLYEGRSSPGDIMRHVVKHNYTCPPAFRKLWDALRNGKNLGGVMAKASWAVYLDAIELAVKSHPKISKAQLALDLASLPQYYSFPNGHKLMAYSEQTLLRKLRNSLPDKKAGRPRKESGGQVDMAAIAQELMAK